MKKYPVFVAFYFLCCLAANAQAFILPSGVTDDATILSCDSVQITPFLTFQQGVVWYKNQLDLNSPIDFTFEAYFGTSNGQGADGMAFIIQNQSQALGPQGSLGGAQLGYYSFPGKSMAIEFDTHNNGPGAPYGDIAAHHIAIDTGGIQFPQAAAPVPMLASSANVDDGNWHKIEIVWTPGTETMSVYFDGSLRLSCVFNPGLVASVFGGQNMLYWGWAGCTGSKFDQQQIYIPFQANFSAAVNYSQCGLTNVPFSDSSISGLHNIASYAWDFGDGGTSTQQNPLHTYAQSGQYSVKLTVTDAVGCTSDTTIKVSVHSVPVITPSQTNITCNGDNNGIARAITTGGTQPYSFQWLPFAVSTTDSATSLAPGTYGVIVTDQNHCADTAAFIITQPQPLTDSISKINVLCYGQSTGSISNTVQGGTTNYSYLWNPSVSTSASAVNLGSGTYFITVTDAHGCSLNESATITQPPLLTASKTDSNILCFGNSTGFITISANGGTQPYSYNWAPNVSTGSSATNLSAGTYIVTLTDANGCSLSDTTTLTQPAQALSLSVTAIPVLCYGYPTGRIIAVASGGTPAYTYSISDGGAPTTNSSGTFSSLMPAAYVVIVTDNNLCPVDTTVTVAQPPQLVIDSLIPTSPRCYHYQDGKVIVKAGGGTPGYEYHFSTGENDTSGVLSNLSAGSYSVTVTDSSNCSATATTSLTQPDSVLIDVTPVPAQVKLGNELQLNTSSNQTSTVTYNWSPEFGLSCYDCPDPLFNGIYSQPYKVSATNQDSCFGTFSFTVTVVPDYDIFFPNAFVPGSGGVNSSWQIFGNIIAIKELEVSVFDRIGEKVFESTDINFTWDGTFKGKAAPVGNYVYQCKVVWLNNYSEKTFVGSITLLR